MQRGYEQAGALSDLVNPHQGRWVGSKKTIFYVEYRTKRSRFKWRDQSKWRKALLTLPARAKTGERDEITACFAMSSLIMQ